MRIEECWSDVEGKSKMGFQNLVPGRSDRSLHPETDPDTDPNPATNWQHRAAVSGSQTRARGPGAGAGAKRTSRPNLQSGFRRGRGCGQDELHQQADQR